MCCAIIVVIELYLSFFGTLEFLKCGSTLEGDYLFLKKEEFTVGLIELFMFLP